ncbi:hypothetical protein ANS017_24990 [Paraclostridium bifermentans]|uniref:hypothetical protein n=1 Tax=Paraclostridium bifermentans TaxID=1490 RepID=UPI000A174621|nr:hypothetical protein [Paraclostridium bifermentans]OSB09671.1 hypothetical protein B2H97_10230 [Paraclostridium bifermentans]GKZ03935.1 hypothetical protein ANS014_23690 [Paraclostridium bifermentans]GKZ07783.1 hypothetical protein ANS015_26660 [Paraclostridium bifermentans]GKZ11115.1 hypothetical protein ANS017_24990 [Paraclostridium bifermentans]
MGTAKKIFYILITVVEAMMLFGAYLVNYFTHAKMGMLRHVAHKNYIWEQQYPIQNIKYVSILALSILMLIVLIMYLKRKNMLKKIVTIMSITMVLFVIAFAIFVLMYSSEEIRAFYYMSAIFGAVTLIQIIKTFIGVIWYKIK